MGSVKNVKDCERELERRVLFYVSFFAVFFQILAHGNHELLFGFLLGSMFCCLFVFEGTERLFSAEQNRIEVRRDRSYFFSFSVILVLILSADYLFFRRTGGNQMNRFDGGLLLFFLLMFLWMEFRNGYFHEIFHEWDREVKKKENSKKYILGILWKAVFICAVSYFLVDGVIGICMKYHIRFSLAGVFFLSWVVQILNITGGRDFKSRRKISETMTVDGIVLFLSSFGLGAVYSPFSVSYEEIISLIILSIFSIFLVWRDKVGERIAGSLMLTMYVAGVVVVLRLLL